MNIHSFTHLLEALLIRKISFAVTFFVVFFVSYGVLAWADFLPEAPKPVSATHTETVPVNASSTEIERDESKDGVVAGTSTAALPQATFQPDTIIFDSLDRSVAVLNPTSRAIDDLDAALLYGVVRHPDSALMGQLGTVFILGHSSYLPTVLNNNFKAFNGIQNLKFGDTVRLQSDGVEYVYRVDKVYKANAAELTVPIAGEVQRLVLATCNSFGSTDDRYIVEADLLETKTI